MDLNAIKLIIWDLDETLWNGTLSEGSVVISEDRIDLIKRLTDKGIIQSICSKNDYDQAKAVLYEYGIWDYFVFTSINWEAKGRRIAKIISDMGLRSCNVLFIDDNPSNLKEAVFYSAGLQTAAPSVIPALWIQCNSLKKEDTGHSRLKQYKVLEKKRDEKIRYSDNREFLMQSHIKADICDDCNLHFERIHELLMRTNQLNFTKNRLSEDELKTLLDRRDVKSGYVRVSDDYGDYGISGFYSLESGRLTNFAFSCRTMGMGVEQYVYAKLGFPKLTVIGETACTLNPSEEPDWINQGGSDTSGKAESVGISNTDFHALIKGPCDMEQILGYIQNDECFTSEFTYINPESGVSIESYNHTIQIVEAHDLSEQAKKTITDELPFASPDFFSGRFYSEENDIVFFSLLTDPNLGLYRRRETEEIVAFGEYCYDLTDPENWNGYISGEIFNANCRFSKENLAAFAEGYEYIGRIKPEEVLKNLKKIRSCMPQRTVLVLLLGVEFPYPENEKRSCEDRHLYHQRLNALVRSWAETQEMVKVLEFGSFVTGPKDMLNNINHFVKPVYFRMAQEFIDLINHYGNGMDLKRKSWLYMRKTYFFQASRVFRLYMKVRTGFAAVIKGKRE